MSERFLATDKTAGIHIYRSQRFCLIEYQIAAGFELDLAGHGFFDFLLNVIQVKKADAHPDNATAYPVR